MRFHEKSRDYGDRAYSSIYNFLFLLTSVQVTLLILDPSILYLVRFPTISAGYTKSSSMASCTAVRVRERGRWTAEPFFGGRTILRVASRTTSCRIIREAYETCLRVQIQIYIQLKPGLTCILTKIKNCKCWAPYSKEWNQQPTSCKFKTLQQAPSQLHM
jgi:hypothetical protein